ncbi:16S rRNA (guanine(527)-N(7))-methyltransferase RsmG [Stappia sp. ES.058]|uniref:16S rRNA (guanine(527)-N(7))-methyltransferase RsmG n=1 Tax=Stappia sp. ES.058 TaxID=1881061 RepID=UPI00087BBAA8|nr:16S rRNA (guanine(527)-N(7))-methyltransferase RsmG [Stappia sp. ES.058]SDU41833.1 16S rRNA (guanine527-N7)-methyltransferase [Stappia sp. ES.058]
MSRPADVSVTDSPQVLHDVFPVSRETEERLRIYVDLLMRWQKAQNLVAPSTLPDVWRRHVADSLQVLKAAEGARQWVDLGSGAGFPGLVTAITLMQNAESAGRGHVHLVESNQRKVAFLRAVIRETGCPATVHADRIEAVAEELASSGSSPIQAVSARALADLSGLCGFAEPFVRHGALAIFHKGKNFRDEVTQASDAWDFDMVEQNSLIDPDSRLLILKRIRPCGATGKG